MATESMICDHDPLDGIEMEKDLARGGWTWQRPYYTDILGRTYLGPHKAWHIWHGGEEEWLAVAKERGLR